MGNRLGYVFRAMPPATRRREIEADRIPRNEYDLFTERDSVTPIALEGSESASRLALHLLDRSDEFETFVFTGEDIGIPAALLFTLARRTTPLCVVFHGHLMESWKFPLAARILRQNPNLHWLCLSQALADRLSGQFGFSPAQCHAVGYGIDNRFFAPAASVTQSSAPIIASAGLGGRDYDTLFAAARDLPILVKIAADSAFCPNIDLSSGLPIPKNVEMRSWKTFPNLRDLYSSATIIVVPLHNARHASGYAVILEAMAMGKPLIVTRTEAECDLVRDGETAICVAPGDPAAMRAAITDLLENPQKAARLGRAALASIKSRGDLTSYAASMDRVIDHATDRRSHGRFSVRRAARQTAHSRPDL